MTLAAEMYRQFWSCCWLSEFERAEVSRAPRIDPHQRASSPSCVGQVLTAAYCLKCVRSPRTQDLTELRSLRSLLLEYC